MLIKAPYEFFSGFIFIENIDVKGCFNKYL